MRVAHFDPFSGASGDMVVGALLDAGASLDEVRQAVLSTGLEGVSVRAERTERGGLAGTRFLVELGDKAPGQGGHDHRGLAEILPMIERSSLAARAKGRAAAAFRLLAGAEGRVHGQSAEEVHFHEVGAADAVADVVGAAAALENLAVESVSSGAPALGHDGFIECAHGRLPLPAPAVAEILRGRAVKPGSSGVEQTTPTGAALLAALAPAFGPMPEMELERIGCGAGSRRDERGPNLLRVFIGRTQLAGAEPPAGEQVLEITATLDNLSGEVLGYLFERLSAEGALEVSLLPATLKKSRAGVHLVVLAPAGRLDAVARAIFRETPTLGLRYWPTSRLVLARRFEEVATRWGTVKVKCGLLAGELVTASPEYEDCRRLAQANAVPLREVQAEAMRLFAEQSRPK